MFLSKKEILKEMEEGNIAISPFEPGLLKAASYTFRLADKTEVAPGQFIVLQSLESISLSENVGGLLSTRGSIAKLGIDALGTDTVVEPGSQGNLAFCTTNHSGNPVTLKAGVAYVKIMFFKTL